VEDRRGGPGHPPLTGRTGREDRDIHHSAEDRREDRDIHHLEDRDIHHSVEDERAEHRDIHHSANCLPD
jgi:hypothetical protein